MYVYKTHIVLLVLLRTGGASRILKVSLSARATSFSFLIFLCDLKSLYVYYKLMNWRDSPDIKFQNSKLFLLQTPSVQA